MIGLAGVVTGAVGLYLAYNKGSGEKTERMAREKVNDEIQDDVPRRSKPSLTKGPVLDTFDE